MLPMLLLLAADGFHAGAAEVDITPTQFPVIVNCGFAERTTSTVTSPLKAKAIVLRERQTTVALAFADSCMMPRPLIDRAKAIAQSKTGIPTDKILIAATHTHTAPSVHACLGSDEQPDYAAFLAEKLAAAIQQAHAKLQPAEIGATAIDVPTHTHNRRWIYLADKALTDPFGQANVFANMHPGYQNANAVSPSGPVDPALTLLSIRTRPGRPLAILANYSMHYFGANGLSADYSGLLADQIKARHDGAVVAFAQGTSGDLHWMDYAQPKRDVTIAQYVEGLAAKAIEALAQTKHASTGVLAMNQTILAADWRRPDAGRLAWARATFASLEGAKPKTQPHIYAREAIMLHEKPKAELVLQALRIGPLAITALPNEVFAITGLKLKQRSPLPLTMNIELANGAEGYIPPPEQHALGGYTTWPARTAGLAVDTEPRAVEALLGLLEKTTGQRRRATPPARVRDHWALDGFEAPFRIEGKHALAVEGRQGRAVYLLDATVHLPVELKPGEAVSYWFWPARTRQWEQRTAASAVIGPLEGKIDEVRLVKGGR